MKTKTAHPGPKHPEHQSFVIDCSKPPKPGTRFRCRIDCDDPDEYDELRPDGRQCVTFWCEACKSWQLCETWQRS